VTRFLAFLFIALCLCLSASAQVAPEPMTIVPGQGVEREIAGGESHTYQIALQAGQFVRLRLEQRAIDAALILTAPDGKQVEMDLTGVGEQESLSLEAPVAGSYRLTVRGSGASSLRGSYRLEITVQAAATAQDRKRLVAEGLLLEASKLNDQETKTTEQALGKLEQVLPVWRELDEPFWIAYSLYSMGSAHADLGQSEKATSFYEQALAVTREFKLRAREWQTLNRLGDGCYSTRQYEKAIAYYEQALVICREVKDRAAEGGVLNNLGVAYNTLRRAQKAVEYYEQALAIKRELKDRAGEAGTLQDLGWAFIGASRSEEAIASFEQSLPIVRELKDRNREGVALDGLGMVQISLSRFEKVIEYYEQALAIKRELKDREGEGFTLMNLGVAYASLSRYEKAIEYSEQALAISRDTKARFMEGRTLSDLGKTYNAMGRPDKAIEYLEQALAINREVRDRMVEGYTLSSLGSAYYKQGVTEKAIAYYEQALVIYRDIKRRPQEGGALNSLGEIYRGLRQYEKSVKYSEQALAISREVKNPQYELQALSNLAHTDSDLGNLAQARSHIEEGLRVAESVRSEIISPVSRATLLATVQGSYQLYTDILMRQHKSDPSKGLDALAVEVSERQRARSLLDLLTEAHTDVRQGVDATLIERERTLAKQLNDKAQQLAQATKPEQAATLKQEVSQLETDLERAQAAIRKANPRYAALVQPQPLKLKEIQAQLDADTLLLEYALGEERSYLWAITKDSLTSYELPKEELIEKSARQVYELLTARSTSKRGETGSQRQERISQAEANLPAAARGLSQTILAPVVAELGNRRLVIVADGALQYIPFAMLPEPVRSGQLAVGSEKKNSNRALATNYQPLIVGHEVVSLPSASALAIQRTELAGRQLAPKMLAVIADPVFDRSDSRFTTLPSDTGDKTQTKTIGADDARSIEHLAENSGDTSGVTTLRLVIPRLPFTRQEANQLMALTPRESSFRAIDFQASRATVLDPGLGQYRYLHFATHGYLDSERPGLSALVFSMVDAQGKPQNGFLRANDIYNLKLPAELVVLSACQTGLGKEIKGEGLVGLTRGFMYAGAARVVVSLWNVNDKATADLMTKFYEKMLRQGARPAAALRAAQVEMWKQKQWQSPYYWAAFTMQGEWR
jgi:CHAT domain-containing protein/tetratricopeptide (TPR) repeat protein